MTVFTFYVDYLGMAALDLRIRVIAGPQGRSAVLAVGHLVGMVMCFVHAGAILLAASAVRYGTGADAMDVYLMLRDLVAEGRAAFADGVAGCFRIVHVYCLLTVFAVYVRLGLRFCFGLGFCFRGCY